MKTKYSNFLRGTEFVILLLLLFSLTGLIIPGPIERRASSQMEFYFVISKILRFGFMSIAFSILLVYIHNLKMITCLKSEGRSEYNENSN